MRRTPDIQITRGWETDFSVEGIGDFWGGRYEDGCIALSFLEQPHFACEKFTRGLDHLSIHLTRNLIRGWDRNYGKHGTWDMGNVE